MPTLRQVINALLQLGHPPLEQPGNPTPPPWPAPTSCSRLAQTSGAKSRATAPAQCGDGCSLGEAGSPSCARHGLTCGRCHPRCVLGSKRRRGINAALPSDNLPSTCSLHSRHFVTRTLPARVTSLTRCWRTRQSGSELNLGYPKGTGSCFVRPGWSNKGSWKSALKNPPLVILHLV